MRVSILLDIRGWALAGATRRDRWADERPAAVDADAALEKLGERFVRAWKTGKPAGDTLAFESPAALFRVMTPKRWEVRSDFDA
jgi:hypothetical protein